MFRPTLGETPLTQSVPLPPPCSASDFIRQDPRQALPWISMTSIAPAPECDGPADPSQPPPPCLMHPLFTFDDLADPSSVAASLHPPANVNAQFLLSQLTPATVQALAAWDGKLPVPSVLSIALIADLSSLLQTWSVRRDLLESGPDDLDFVGEVDNDGFGHPRFGDGAHGRMPDAGTLFRADYRVGNGTPGNVGAETITYLVLRTGSLSGVNLQPRNPLPATGGVDPEPLEDVRLFAPYAFRSRLERAITAADYAALAADNERRLRVACRLRVRRRGHLHGVVHAPPGRQGGDAMDRQLVHRARGARSRRPRRRGCRAGRRSHAVPRAVPPDGLRSACQRRALRAAEAPDHRLRVAELPARTRRSGGARRARAIVCCPTARWASSIPTTSRFGGGVFVSRILAAVQAIPGVQNAIVTELERYEVAG